MVTRFLAVLACCGLLSLAACTDGSSSATDPPTPSVSSSSADPTPTEEAETPEEFVQRWVEADSEMENSGETSDVSRVESSIARLVAAWRTRLKTSMPLVAT